MSKFNEEVGPSTSGTSNTDNNSLDDLNDDNKDVLQDMDEDMDDEFQAMSDQIVSKNNMRLLIKKLEQNIPNLNNKFEKSKKNPGPEVPKT